MGLKDIAIKSLGRDFLKMYIKLKISDKEIASQTIEGYNLIRDKKLFDDDFYLEKYPKLKDSDLDLLLHYIFFGFDEGKSPSSNFDGVFYKNHYEDANESKLNPLVHYALYGEGRLIKPDNIPICDFVDENKKRILYISHEKVGTVGGTGFTNLDIIGEINENYQTFILTSTGYEVELWKIDNQKEKIAHYDISYDTDFTYGLDNTNEILTSNFSMYNKELKEVYNNILKDLKIDLIHINHFINHSLDLIDLSINYKIPYILSIHDFYYICPSIHLINNKSSYCNLTCLNNDFSCDCVKLDDKNKLEEIIKIYRENTFNLLNNAYKIIFPSKSAIDLYEKFFPDLDNFKLIEHGRDFTETKINPILPKDSKIKIAIPGHVSPHKGSFFIRDIKKEDTENRLDLIFVGTTRPSLKDIGKTTGRYVREDLSKILVDINPCFVAILSTCPETYSHILSESWALGLPVIATNLGALSERIQNTSAGWLIDYENPEKAYNQILNISKNQEDYLEKVKNINNITFKSKKEMANDYQLIYDEMRFD